MKTRIVSVFLARLTAALFALLVGLSAPSALAVNGDDPATKSDIMRLDGRIAGLEVRISELSERLARLEGTNELLAMMATGSFLCLMGLLVALVVDILVRTRAKPPGGAS